ncbi:MAG TPA: glycosyltransferase family A protein [Gemmatimonadaceae bacterium]|nr:glycosyltransferase family A protein [Gemmatimonadaceae bacterium]
MLVSVIIATHDFGQYIEEAVTSVLSQGIADLECIVVDDASTDDTCQRLMRIEDCRLRVIPLTRVGVGAARNRGLDEATGKYIAFLDADDRWCPTKLQRQLAVLESEPDLGLVFTNFTRFDAIQGTYAKTQFDYVPELRRLPIRPSRAGDGFVIEADSFTSLVATSQFATWIQTVLLRADQVQGIRFPADMRLSQDLCYMLRVYPKVRSGFLAEPLVEVRRHSTNSFQRPAEKLGPDLEAFARAAREVTSRAHKSAARQRLGRAWLNIGYHAFWAGHPLPAARAFLHALRFPKARRKAITYLALTPAASLLARTRPTTG